VVLFTTLYRDAGQKNMKKSPQICCYWTEFSISGCTKQQETITQHNYILSEPHHMFRITRSITGVHRHEIYRPTQRFNLPMRQKRCTLRWIKWSEACGVVPIEYSCVERSVWCLSYFWTQRDDLHYN